MQWTVKNSNIPKFISAIIIMLILAAIIGLIGLIYGIQYIGPVATVVTVSILAFQAWYNKKTAELMKQSMLIPLRREHTEQLKNEVIQPLYEILSQLELRDNKLRVAKSTGVSTLVTTIDFKPLLENNNPDKRLWKLLLIAFANSADPDLDIYLLYDLIEHHLPQKFLEQFKSLVLAAIGGKKSDFREQLDNMKEILSAFETFMTFSDDCPYIQGAIDKEQISKLIEEVKELKKKIKKEPIKTEKNESFLY